MKGGVLAGELKTFPAGLFREDIAKSQSIIEYSDKQTEATAEALFFFEREFHFLVAVTDNACFPHNERVIVFSFAEDGGMEDKIPAQIAGLPKGKADRGGFDKPGAFVVYAVRRGGAGKLKDETDIAVRRITAHCFFRVTVENYTAAQQEYSDFRNGKHF